MTVEHVDELQLAEPMNLVAETYVGLALSMGAHDADYVDAYYGPDELRQRAVAESLPLTAIRDRALSACAELAQAGTADVGMSGQRRRFLTRQLQALASRADMLNGTRMSFDQESQALYGAVAPIYDEAHFVGLIEEFDDLLPGSEEPASRYAAFTRQFVVPEDNVADLMRIAIAECRQRTLARIGLPAGERFDLELVRGKSWSAQNYYQGGYRSRILINLDLPMCIDRIIDLAGHEGYPGHHVYGTLMERDLVHDRGWLEFSVFPLFSPAALILEGTAMLAPEVEFPGEERVAFEREALYPLAGLNSADAQRYDRVRTIAARLGHAVNQAARRYLDGDISADEAQRWLVSYALQTPGQAEQRIAFIDQYRTYVINYNVGRDLVSRYIEDRGGTADQPQRRWEIFQHLLHFPELDPSSQQTAS